LVPLVLSPDGLSRNADELCKFTCGEHVASCQYLRRAVYSPLPRFLERRPNQRRSLPPKRKLRRRYVRKKAARKTSDWGDVNTKTEVCLALAGYT
jgi:hypothetical protein